MRRTASCWAAGVVVLSSAAATPSQTGVAPSSLRLRTAAAKCPHERRRASCVACGGSSICEHQRIRRQCRECIGRGRCERNRHTPFCVEASGTQVCPHGSRTGDCSMCVLRCPHRPAPRLTPAQQQTASLPPEWAATPLHRCCANTRTRLLFDHPTAAFLFVCVSRSVNGPCRAPPLSVRCLFCPRRAVAPSKLACFATCTIDAAVVEEAPRQ